MVTPEVQAFLDATLAAQLDAERALHNGDVVPRLSTWSHGDQITLFGAGAYRSLAVSDPSARHSRAVCSTKNG